MLAPKDKNSRIVTIEMKSTEEILATILSNLYIIGIKAKNYHWNTEGPNFYGDHKTYDTIYEGAYDHIDIIGERMRALQYKVRSDLPFLIKNSTVSNDFEDESEEMCCDMVEVLEEFSSNILENMMYVDRTTENLLQETDAWAGKMAYFVRSTKPEE
ncbi:putative DNA starvation/stationary phase protection protein [Aeromonas phage LAh_9]|uniref:DNA-binding protein n=4 Tax=Lahexavirus TaxID=2843411 RepID=A0A514A0K0_9CAUD|nr:DNA binding protein [Aeromonas phage 4_4572]YP_009847256.1 DNA binding protein [Aeromonas phage LAh_6]YP_009847463.1 DNA binding protein [Aeromonas phage LAh_8]YP_009847568.1 DNA binding protein [Aeromonas phage LAh_9]QDH46540.1 putative DNA-binding protein [Aeromonas phage LAh_6]QDH46776.1 DNA-binding protein [Aeromonas phage LAh_8]QDH46920.1 putative DNA starvation/stationary phase protection protein [Aeromonas phage LAh_9]QEG09011.1 DNA-binding protein [Aeromonas phage 4_4572]